MIPKLLRLMPIFRGKQRIARTLLKGVISKFANEVVKGSYGCAFKVPNIVENIGFEIFINGVYEKALISFIIHRVKKNGIFFDLGANIGAISVPICKQRPDMQTICVEAAPWICEYLEFNVKLNKIENIAFFNYAMAEENNKKVDFFSPHDAFGKGSMAAVFTTESVSVTTTTIDYLVENVIKGKKIDLIKVDVEGFEYHTFLGGKSIFNSNEAPDILFEFVDWAESSATNVHSGAAQELLMSYGYNIHIFENGSIGQRLSMPLRNGSTMLFATKEVIN